MTTLAEVAADIPQRMPIEPLALEQGPSPMRVKVFAAAGAALGATFPAMVFPH